MLEGTVHSLQDRFVWTGHFDTIEMPEVFSVVRVHPHGDELCTVPGYVAFCCWPGVHGSAVVQVDSGGNHFQREEFMSPMFIGTRLENSGKFYDWLRRQSHRVDSVGDVARDALWNILAPRQVDNLAAWILCYRASHLLEPLRTAWGEFQNEG